MLLSNPLPALAQVTFFYMLGLRLVGGDDNLFHCEQCRFVLMRGMEVGAHEGGGAG